jgi:hypothetical protein
MLQGGFRGRGRRDGRRSDAVGGVAEVTYLYARSNGSIIAPSFHFYVTSVDASPPRPPPYREGL